MSELGQEKKLANAHQVLLRETLKKIDQFRNSLFENSLIEVVFRTSCVPSVEHLSFHFSELSCVHTDAIMTSFLCCQTIQTGSGQGV
jgi:hypothetical protein